MLQEKNGEYNKDRVIAITVTYNRSHTLKNTIKALLNQTFAVHKIIIVDNNSNITERENIREIQSSSENIDVVWLSENVGGAGGFERGMSTALSDYDADWYWIMDDDAYPRTDCLEKLLSYKNKLNNVGCLAPVIYGIDYNQYQLYHHKIISKYTMKDKKVENDYSSLKEVTKIDANAFVGPLFKKEAVETVGVADGSLFIYGDDTEYTYRVSQNFNIFLIKDAVIDHQDPPKSKKMVTPSSWWKEYYELRNRYLFINKYQENLLKRTILQSYMAYKITKKIAAAMLKTNYKGVRKLRVSLLLSALRDGITGQKGKTIDPVQFLDRVNKISN
jgi:rhamnopyranosyl-N-acetylglucosaminyl-diphospho-decaprenol beta-1,3/1,4-galactofuranosyltransferase